MGGMQCDGAAEWIEALTDGEDGVPGEVRAHVDGCAGCTADLALARRLSGLLAEAPPPPVAFTAGVTRRVRREWWRGEQALDRWFNALLAGGSLALVAGLSLLLAQVGALPVAADLVAASMRELTVAFQNAAPGVPAEVTATAVFVGGVVLWRWLSATEA